MDAEKYRAPLSPRLLVQPSRSHARTLRYVAVCAAVLLLLYGFRQAATGSSSSSLSSQSPSSSSGADKFPSALPVTQKLSQSPKTFKSCDDIPLPEPVQQHGEIQDLWQALQEIIAAHPPLRPGQDKGNGTFDYTRFDPSMPISKEDAEHYRQIHQDFLGEAMPRPREGLFKGQGIIMVAGGQDTELAATSLGLLRLMGSKLPAELWFVDEVEAMDHPGWCDELGQQGVACRFLSTYVPSASSTRSAFPWGRPQHVMAALMFSSFAEFLYLEPRTLVLETPDTLFSDTHFRETGAVLWPDYWWSTQRAWAQYITNASPDAPAEENKDNFGSIDIASQLWSKTVHWDTFLLTTYYAAYSPFFFPLFSDEDSTGRGLAASMLSALRTTGAPHLRVSSPMTQVRDSDPNGDRGSVSVGLLHPSPQDSAHNILMPMSVLRFGVRQWFCDENCIELHVQRPAGNMRMIGTKVRTIGIWGSPGDPLHGSLRSGRRLISWNQLAEEGVGETGSHVLRVMERLACEGGAWSSPGFCTNAAEYAFMAVDNFKPWRGECEAT